jgi:hypothetical protein
MDRNKWPKLIFSTEHDSQEQEGPGELTQEDNVINEKDIRGSANARFSIPKNRSMKEEATRTHYSLMRRILWIIFLTRARSQTWRMSAMGGSLQD